MPDRWPAPRHVLTPAFADARGWVAEAFNPETERAIGQSFVQDNLTFSAEGTLRGLHFQTDPAQGKLIRVISGRIWDVVVDLRAGSPDRGRWQGFWLEAAPEQAGAAGWLWIPAGYAHGFCVPQGGALVWYKLSHPRDPAAERVIAWDDPDLAIPWPVSAPVLSPRDAQGGRLRDTAPICLSPICLPTDQL